MKRIYDVIIIGAGPAGLMAANVANERQLDYLILDSNPLPGKKLLITGGTRCNVTNPYDVRVFIDKLYKKNKRFLYSTLKNFGSEEVKSFFEDRNVPLTLENNMKYFPKSSKSKDILNALLLGIDKEKMLLNETVKSIDKKTQFEIKTNSKNFSSRNIVLATGSKSYPATGSKGDGGTFASKLGHQVIDFYPAETNVHSGLVSSNREFLQGIAISNSQLRIKGTKYKFEGDFIFTHFGLGGPVVQTASEYIYHSIENGLNEITLSLTTHTEEELVKLFSANENVLLQKFLESILIKRLARYIMKHSKLHNIKISELSKKQILKIIQTLKAFEIKIDRVEDREKSFVNGGGITTDEINPKTMESKIIKGLYFAGETMDIHGPIGGFNITIALSSGFTALTNMV